MPVVRFSWNPQLVDVRREACPRARWNSQTRAWMMTATEAEAFVTAGHHRLDTAGWLAKSWLMARSGLWGSFKVRRERPRRTRNLPNLLAGNCLPRTPDRRRHLPTTHNRREGQPNDQTRDQGTDRGTGTEYPSTTRLVECATMSTASGEPSISPGVEKKLLYAATAVRAPVPGPRLYSGTCR